MPTSEFEKKIHRWASLICCFGSYRCLVRVGSILGSESSATCWNWICRCLVRVGIICNLLELDLQMPGQGWKHLQLAEIGAADA